MSYLKNQTVASAQALFVTCRYLAIHRAGGTVEQLQKALAPKAVTGETGRAGRTADVPYVLLNSLDIGVDIGLLDVEGSRGQRVWTLRNEYTNLVKELPATDSRRFRSLLLRRFGARALISVEAGESPPDVPFGLAWFLTRDPMSPWPEKWDQEVEEAWDRASMRSAVHNQEQWRPFIRWARALGLVTMIGLSGKNRIAIDPTQAVREMLDEMPKQSPATEWLGRLYAVQPLLGDPRLLNALPSGNTIESGPSAALVLALFKLERAGRLTLVAADDASDAVVLRLGGQARRVARIHSTERVA